MEDVLRIAGNVLMIWAAVVGTVSVIVHARVPWWRSHVGQHLMIYMLAIAAVLDLSVIRIFLGDTTWFAALRLVVFIAVPIAMTQRLWLQIQAQRRPTDQREV